MNEENKENKISFMDENGEVTEFFVWEETKINGKTYLLVSDSDEDGADAWILEEISEKDAEEKRYVPVTSENELSYLSKIFAELLEDTTFE